MLTADLPEILPSANFAVIVKSLGSIELSVHPVRRQAVPSSVGASLPEPPHPATESSASGGPESQTSRSGTVSW